MQSAAKHLARFVVVAIDYCHNEAGKMLRCALHDKRFGWPKFE